MAAKRQHAEPDEEKLGPERKRARTLADDDDESEESTIVPMTVPPVAYTSDDERDSIYFFMEKLFDKTKKELEVERRSAWPRRSAQNARRSQLVMLPCSDVCQARSQSVEGRNGSSHNSLAVFQRAFARGRDRTGARARSQNGSRHGGARTQTRLQCENAGENCSHIRGVKQSAVNARAGSLPSCFLLGRQGGGGGEAGAGRGAPCTCRNRQVVGHAATPTARHAGAMRRGR